MLVEGTNEQDIHKVEEIIKSIRKSITELETKEDVRKYRQKMKELGIKEEELDRLLGECTHPIWVRLYEIMYEGERTTLANA